MQIPQNRSGFISFSSLRMVGDCLVATEKSLTFLADSFRQGPSSQNEIVDSTPNPPFSRLEAGTNHNRILDGVHGGIDLTK